MLRAEIIVRHARLVEALAARFVVPGSAASDLLQGAWLALIDALDRFDSAHEARFTAYARRCVLAELERRTTAPAFRRVGE